MLLYSARTKVERRLGFKLVQMSKTVIVSAQNLGVSGMPCSSPGPSVRLSGPFVRATNAVGGPLAYSTQRGAAHLDFILLYQ